MQENVIKSTIRGVGAEKSDLRVVFEVTGECVGGR